MKLHPELARRTALYVPGDLPSPTFGPKYLLCANSDWQEQAVTASVSATASKATTASSRPASSLLVPLLIQARKQPAAPSVAGPSLGLRLHTLSASAQQELLCFVLLRLPSHQTTNRSASNERQIKLDTWEEHQTSICAWNLQNTPRQIHLVLPRAVQGFSRRLSLWQLATQCRHRIFQPSTLVCKRPSTRHVFARPSIISRLFDVPMHYG